MILPHRFVNLISLLNRIPKNNDFTVNSLELTKDLKKIYNHLKML